MPTGGATIGIVGVAEDVEAFERGQRALPVGLPRSAARRRRPRRRTANAASSFRRTFSP